MYLLTKSRAHQQQQNVQYKSPSLQPKHQQQQQADSTIDFNSIFNKYNNLASVNLINPAHNQTSRNSNGGNNDCLLSTSSSSTSSSSSANQPNLNQTLLDYNNNNTLTNKTSEPLNFNSRSLGAFQPTNATTHQQTQHKSSLKSYKNGATNGSETNLSVKTAVKVFESSNSSGLTQGHKLANTYSSHSSLNHHTPKHTLQPSTKQALTNNNQSTNNLNSPLLSFNKQKRSSSIDNVISSFTANSTSQQFNHGKQNGYNLNGSNSKNGSYSKNNKEANTSFSNPRSSSKQSNNLYLTGTDLRDLLDSFNLSTSQLTGNGVENSRSKPDDSYMSSQQQGNTIASRSRSLHRDGGSYYMDINGQRKKLIGESSTNNSHKLKSSPSSVAAHDQSGYSAFNSSSMISQRSQYESDSNQNVLYNSSDLNSSSHVVPKPPPGNPQRNTNLYPAAR